jgi:hypothetical protein
MRYVFCCGVRIEQKTVSKCLCASISRRRVLLAGTGNGQRESQLGNIPHSAGFCR